jgi:uncharacterized protein YhfF
MQQTAEIKAFWDSFKGATGETNNQYSVVRFGDTPDMENELADLVISGAKRATASLLHYYSSRDEPMPRVGDLALVVDGRGLPRCIYRVTQVDVKPLSAVDDRFAWDEGEGDRSLAWWMEAHRSFFARQAARDNFHFHDEIDVVLERFEVVWPGDVADSAHASRYAERKIEVREAGGQDDAG